MNLADPMTPAALPPTNADVLQAVRQTLAAGPREYLLPDFLAAVDWSEAVRPAPEVADLLGRLELWDSEYREGDLGWDEFATALSALDADAA